MKRNVDKGWGVVMELLTYLKQLKATFRVETGESFYKVLIVQNSNEYIFGDVMEKVIGILKGRCKRFAFMGKQEGIEIFISF